MHKAWMIAALLTAGLAQAQGYPHKPIRMIVASAPGGAPDSRAGASVLIGAELAANAAADGYTLFLGTTTLYAILPNLKKNLPYDIRRDFASITQIAAVSNVLVINPSVPAKSVTELLAYARAKPGTLNYASAHRYTSLARCSMSTAASA